MKSSIKEILFKELDKRGVSIYRFAIDSGIPKSRINQWKRGNGNPKENDIRIIQEWLGQLPAPLPESVVNDDQPNYGTITIPAADYINELKKHNSILENAILVSLTAIQGVQKSQGDGLAHFASEVITKLNEIQLALSSVSKEMPPISSRHKLKQGHR
jgi:transcriptional regulator with XRE-family HTH domain